MDRRTQTDLIQALSKPSVLNEGQKTNLRRYFDTNGIKLVPGSDLDKLLYAKPIKKEKTIEDSD